MRSPTIQHLIQLCSKMPGLGPRSGRRLALHLMQNKKNVFEPFLNALNKTLEKIQICQKCGNLDEIPVCSVCLSETRDQTTLCILAGVDDLWAMERTGIYKGIYHILGGTLSALDGIGPDQLRLDGLKKRLQTEPIKEVIVALSLTLEGQTTAHYIADLLKPFNVRLTKLAQGVPMGGELDYLDEGTISAAFQARSLFHDYT